MSLPDEDGSVPNGRSTRRRAQDLDLRLGLSKTTTLSNHAFTIVVEDDDDDVRVLSPRSVAQARSSACSRSNRPVHIPVLDDEDLELRLGLAGLGPAVTNPQLSGGRLEPPTCTSGPNLEGAFGLSLSATIDLTFTNNYIAGKPRTTGKRKQMQPPPETVKEIKLICAICMDTMKEETSTVCGHIFCGNCIKQAMQAQKKCPTCRKKLANNQVHRIYFSGSTS